MFSGKPCFLLYPLQPGNQLGQLEAWLRYPTPVISNKLLSFNIDDETTSSRVGVAVSLGSSIAIGRGCPLAADGKLRIYDTIIIFLISYCQIKYGMFQRFVGHLWFGGNIM